MDTYSWMRQFADSWMLLAMTLFFLGVIVWAFRPGSKATHRDTANIPFRNETLPVSDNEQTAAGKDDILKMGGAS
ncbi:CcoQ/FixQ family Cbb3-type cytochrome c oxidase assembly chaperone [Sulfitobacter sp. JBTF-M27]|uniref:CcoQ/FixQ family Cbb3-type cytochrome c oxidase assembly chaperone n=1 Tax=Sulfitobacter sediminilitoris TaxID=2698830 RepID=A0A6P0CBP5_9RHOB|nr:cbb3-type cytochrome c oxidase subunit 3 [Sulfitobacter sediminilitoris]NEK21903.1 CcoQ/FixQ family Cbb3-type cytochrome c oxidase assembly chaperone [Sulfitobacter sediminilitoris]